MTSCQFERGDKERHGECLGDVYRNRKMCYLWLIVRQRGMKFFCKLMYFVHGTLMILYNVWGIWSLSSRVYVTYHFWIPICNGLGYWRHRSVCYTSLFTISLVTTISFTMYSDPLMLCLGAVLVPLWICCLDLPWSASLISLLFLSSVPLFSVCLSVCLSVWVWVLCYDRQSVGQSILV
jgi:hypothetical protein